MVEESDETILQEAQRLVHGPRQSSYGHPFDDFSRTGRLWGAILGIPDVPPDKVALCLIGVKISREVNAAKRDNRVDIAGYAEALDLVRQRQEGSVQSYPDYDDLAEICGIIRANRPYPCQLTRGHVGPCL